MPDGGRIPSDQAEVIIVGDAAFDKRNGCQTPE